MKAAIIISQCLLSTATNEALTHHCVAWEFWGRVGIDRTEQPVDVGVAGAL